MSLAIEPLAVGAAVTGLTCGSEADPAVRTALYQAWLQHGFLLFNDINSVQHHLALSRCFGELELHPLPEMRAAEDPLLIEIGGSKRAPAYVYDGELLANRIAWHRDTAYTPDICKGAMLRMLEVPSSAGETLLADTARAYDDLSDRLKQRLEGLEFKATLRMNPISQTGPGAFWKEVRLSTPNEDSNRDFLDTSDEAASARYPSVVHPVVLTHPESGRRCLFLSPSYVDGFLGLDPTASRQLLHELCAHMLHPRYVYRHRWSPNQAIVWDNRRVVHAASGNAPDQPRRGLRTTLAGSIRTGRYFDPAARTSGRLAAAD